MSHAAGVGPAFPREVVRAMLLLRANTLALGSQRLPAAARGPAARLPSPRASTRSCPEQGSVGASGDLAPLAHLALPLIGRGQVEFDGPVVPGADRPARGRPGAADARGEGGAGAPQRHPDDERDRGAAPGRRGPPGADRERRRGDERRGAARDGRRVRRGLPARPAAPGPGRGGGGAPPPPARQRRSRRGHHGHAHKVQDPYSLRCVPQVHGAVRDALDHLRRVLDIELNAATDNPLVFPGGGVADADTMATGGGRVISGGNFHGEPIALALDFAKLALAELGSISERRTALLVDAAAQRRPAAVPRGRRPGVDSGMMIYQYTAAALASENKVLAHPASVDSIPTSANQEDHVSMGSIAARHARTVLTDVERIVAIELLVAAQALDLRLAPMAGPGAAAPLPGAGRGRGASADPGAGPPPRRRPRAGARPRGGDRDRPRRRAGGPRRTAVSGEARPPRWAGSRSSTSPTRRPSASSRRAPTRASTIGRATTGRTPTAAPRRRGWRGSSRSRRRSAAAAAAAEARPTRSSPTSRQGARSPTRSRPPGPRTRS